MEKESPKFITHLSPVPHPLLRPNAPRLYPCLAQGQPREPHSQQNQASWVLHQGGASAYGHPVEARDQGFELVFPHCLSPNLLYPLLTVSVCQKVSTMGQRWSPTTWWYHSQASGLMGSPTVPNTCKDARLCLGQGSGERGIKKTYPGSSAHLPPFQARELEQWHENDCTKASCSKGHQWGSSWEGSHLVTGFSPNFMSRRIAVGAV